MSEWDISPEEERHRLSGSSGRVPNRERAARESAVYDALRGQRLISGYPEGLEGFRTELGHNFSVWLHSHTRRWQVSIAHAGDPTNEVITSDLGEDDARVPDRFRHFMTHPNVVGRLAAQWKRALGNGDPSGDEPDGRVVDHGGAALHSRRLTGPHYGER